VSGIDRSGRADNDRAAGVNPERRKLPLPQPVPWVARMAPYAPPEDLDAVALRAGRTVETLRKLDANENPYGPSPRVAEDLSAYGFYHWYTDPDQKALRTATSAYAGVSSEHLVFGNGSDELIDLLCRMYLQPGDEVIDNTPTFGMYLFSAELCGGIRIEVPRTDDWHVDLEAIRSAVTPRTKLIFVATPNNPTGTWESDAAVEAMLDLGPIVVIDEAYVEFAGASSRVPWTERYENLVVLRTFSKWAGLAGLRIGYGSFPVAMAREIMKIKPPFNVNRAAEVAVLATLDDLPRVQSTVDAIVGERDRLVSGLQRLDGIAVEPSEANFVLVRVINGAAGALREHLVTRGIAVRAYSHPRLADRVRISVGLPSDTDAVVAAIREWD
jgi:histidinol-phosphate aminotransferase